MQKTKYKYKKGNFIFYYTFVKRQNLPFITIHGESANADKSNIEHFKEELAEKCFFRKIVKFLIFKKHIVVNPIMLNIRLFNKDCGNF